MTQIRGIPRILIAVVLLVVISLLLLLSPISGEHGEKSRQIISSVVQKVQGDATKGTVDLAEEELRRWEYRRALVYEGTGARVHEFLDKARSGKPFTVSVVGGSVSKGRGLTPPAHLDNTNASSVLGATTLYSPENLHVLIFDWLNATFPHPENKLVNGAQGGVGSGYFSWCYKEHTADDSDLVLVELGINDLMDVNVFGSYEHFVRGVLEMAHKPAVINVETFTTLFPTLISSSSLHLDVAAFYDLPTVSIRDVLLPRLLANPHEEMPKWFRTGPTVQMGDNKVKEWGGTAVDLMHISSLGHALAAGLVIRYLSEQIEATKPSGTFGRLKPDYMKTKPLRITSFPPAALTIPYDPATGRIRHNPICRSMNSGKYHRPEGDIEAEAQRGIVVDPSTKGWSSWAWKEKIYLVGKEPGALLSVPFNVASLPINTVDKVADDLTSPSAEGEDKSKLGFEPLPLAVRPGAPYNFYPVGVSVEVREGEVEKRQYPEQDGVEGGRVLIGYQQSATIGLGSVWCWVDDDKNEGKQINGWWQIQERNMGMVEEITSGLKSGPHVLHCEILEHTLDPKGGTEFRIFAVMHD